MKPYIHLIVFTSLLASIHARGEDGYYAFVETDAGTPAYIRDTVPYKEYTGQYTHKVEDDQNLSCAIVGQTSFNDYVLITQAFFSKDDSELAMVESGFRAEQGSIIFDNISIKNSDLLTQYDGKGSDTWGLPQIVLRKVNFLPENTSSDPSQFSSNYCTISDWTAEGCTLELMKSGGTFTSGAVTGNVVIDAAGPVKFDGLTISGTLTVESTGTAYLSSKSGLSQLGQQGTLKFASGQQITLGEDPDIGEQIHVIEGNVDVTYTGEGAGPDAWDVDVKSKVEGSLTVTASNGRVNAGILFGTGNLEAKQIYLTSFFGSSLSMTAGKSVLLQGTTDASETVTVHGGQQAEITFEGNLHAGDRVTLEGNTITGDDDESLLSADSLVASAVGHISLAGGIQIAGGQRSTISSTEGSVIFQGATDNTSLKNADIHASTVTMKGMTADHVQISGNTDADRAAVSYSDKLVLNQSAIKGDVKGTKDSCIIQVMESRIDGVVSSAAELTLDSGIIEGAESVFKLASKGTSQISNQNEVTVNTLVLGGGTLTVGTEASHDNDLVMQNLTVDAGTILNANMVLKDGATLEFAENAVVTLGCTVILLGKATFTTGVAVVESPAVPGVVIMDSVEDVLDANRQSITLSWDKDASLPRWHKELYKVGDKTYTTDASASGATLTNLSLVYERTYSDNGPYNGRLFIAALPEPTTGTLGLLALAALAARRRRK